MTGVVTDPPARTAGWSGDMALTVNPVSPVDGEEAVKLYELSRDICAKNGFDFVGETTAIWRSANHRQVLSHAAGKAEDAARAKTCAEALIAAQAEAGFGQILTDPGLGKAVAKTYEKGGRSALHARVKQALDPNSIFASV